MLEVVMSVPMAALGPRIGSGLDLDGHGYSPSRQFSGMLTTFEKTGSIVKTAEEAARDMVTLDEEFFKLQTIIPYEYEVVNGRWTSGGRTLEEIGVGERIERVVRAQERMVRDSNITQAVVASEDTGFGRSYVYLFSRNLDNKNKISALAVEYNGTPNELATLLQNLNKSDDKKIDFVQPLFFTKDEEITVKDFFQAAYESYSSEERRSQAGSYLARLTRDVSDFNNLLSEHQKRVDELARKIEEDLMSNPNVITGMALAVNGLSRVVESWIAEDGDVYYQRLGERSNQIVAISPQVIYETRTETFDYSSDVTLSTPVVREISDEKQEIPAVGLFVQTLIKSIAGRYGEESVKTMEVSQETVQIPETELSIEMVTEVIEPIVPVVEIILQQLVEQETIPSQEEVSTNTPEITLLPEMIMLILAPSEVEDDTLHDAQQLLEILSEELLSDDKSEPEVAWPAQAEEIVEFITANEDLLDVSDQAKELENKTQASIKLLLRIFENEETADDLKELVILFLFHEIKKVYENKELKEKYPELAEIFARFELIFQDPIFLKRYEAFILLVEKLFSSELLKDDGWKDFHIIDLLEFIKNGQHTIEKLPGIGRIQRLNKKPKKKKGSLPKRGIIYQLSI